MQRVDEGTRSRLLNIHGWRGFNNPWMPLDEEDVDFSYINLQQNPERYTGYKVRALPCCTFYAVRDAALISQASDYCQIHQLTNDWLLGAPG